MVDGLEMYDPIQNNKSYVWLIVIMALLGVVVIYLLLNGLPSNPPNPSCNSTWQCSSWGSCLNGQQTRTCTDNNDCGTTAGKPATSQSCSITCTSNWVCSSWSACANNQQTRTCTDLKGCATPTNLPSLTQSCSSTCTESWNCGSWSSCTNSQQSRTCNDANSCGTTANRPALTNVCSNDSLTQIINDYANYFQQNPRIKSVVDKYIDDIESVYERKNGLNDFYKFLQAEENNNNVGAEYDAIKLMAHSVYIDKHNLVPWRLNDYDDEALNMIFRPIDDIAMWHGTYGNYGYNPDSVSTCNPKATYSYAKNLVKNNQYNTVISIVDYMRHFRHALGEEPFETDGCDDIVLKHYSEAEPQINGCTAVAQLMVDLARSINIPAFYHYNLWCDNWFVYGHSAVAFYKIGYIPHGDDVYSYVYPNLKSCQLIIPWNYLINEVIPLKCRNPNSCDNPCNCMQSSRDDPLWGCGYYSFGVGFNPAYESFDRSSISC